jgi:hypothetical protein
MEKIRSARRGILKDFGIMVALIGTLAATILFVPRVLDPVTNRIEDRVLNKTNSRSYEERSMWTRTTFEAGISSHLIGVGIGSVRSSNSAAAVFGTTGLLGVFLYYAFQAKCLLRTIPTHISDTKAALAKSFRWSFWPIFIVSLMIGTTADYGDTGALRWGVILAVCLKPLTQKTLAHATKPKPLQVGKTKAFG